MKTLENLFVGFLCLFATAAVWAQDAGGAVISTLYPRLEYPGGFSAYGGSEVQEIEPNAVVSVKGAGGKAGVILWFAQHRLLSKSTVEAWAGGSLRLEVRSPGTEAAVDFSVAWRGSLDPLQMGTLENFRSELVGSEWTTVDIPIPSVESLESSDVTGLLILLSPGEYEIRRIDIVTAP